MNIGDNIFEIHCMGPKCYVNKHEIKKITDTRIICGFEPFEGVKKTAINQFRRQYRHWASRGHKDYFLMYSLEPDLSKNINFFLSRFRKVTGGDIEDVKYHFEWPRL